MKALKKESRLKIPTSRFLEAAESVKEKKRAKAPEQPTPPIQEEPEPVSNVLQGDDILALAIKKEDLKKQHVPQLVDTGGKPVVTQKFIIRKLKPKDSSRKVYHLVAHPAHPDAATKPLDYSGPGDSFLSGDQILPHQILGSLQDFKRIAVARGNTQLAKLIHIRPCVMTLISAKDEPKPKAPKEEKRPPWAPPLQHNFLKNWRRHVALWKKQQEALSGHLKKPVSELLMHSGENYRKIQEERELIDRALPTQHDRKVFKAANCFWSPLEYLGDEMTGLLMTKTKSQRGLVEPITHVRKPHSIQVETGLPEQKDAWYRYTWDRSLFLVYRRKELRNIMAELDFNQQDIDGLEVVGRGKPFSSITVEEYSAFEKSMKSSSEDTAFLDSLTNVSDMVPMPILGPSLLFCGKPACWIRGSNSEDKQTIGIGVRLTFETLEGEKTSSELTVVNNGTVAIWYDWRRQPQMNFFQDLKRNRTQRFYFNNREGVILPGETKHFTFFFKSLNAGIFRESWEFGTHPTLLGGAVLQVTLHAISLTQDTFIEERKLLESKLAAHEAVTIAQSVLQELLRGVSTPERVPSPVDANLTEEDLFHYRNPRLHYQHQVVQNLHQLWQQYSFLPLKTDEARAGQEDALSSRARPVPLPLVFVDKAQADLEHSMSSRSSRSSKSPVLEASQLQLRQESDAPKETREPFLSQKTGVGTKSFPRKSIMEEILVEESPDRENTRSPWELESLPLPKWNLCLEDFRKAVITFPEEIQREDALIRLNKAAVELCQEQKPLQSDLLHQMILQLWRDVIDSLVSQSLWLRALLGLPEKETVYLDVPEDQGQKSPTVIEVKAVVSKVGKEERKGATQEKKLLGARDKEEKKGAKASGKEDRLNSKKLKAKDDKKVVKSASRDRLSSEDPTPDSTVPSQEPIDPLVMQKYTQRLHAEVYGLLDNLVTDMMILADELSPLKSVEEPLRFCS
ncbi:MYCBP-associated protein isoform X1 [Peromyscus eremicus]|uniref:MYCBP-associated protein isoform X1 n=1 Tax=Peromyscus eremicus TaxID=42410 RepID=UPI0027DD6D04|nr:MYCBP-associated protein isoform X1 [Peromyscus eremicus]